ncbi:hypothetical protein Droror1_Dr00003736 [Drosera rotundifolia]
MIPCAPFSSDRMAKTSSFFLTTKSIPFLLFLSILFLSLVSQSSQKVETYSVMPSTIPSSSSTHRFQPKLFPSSLPLQSSSGKEFEESAHEVPSGPNPITN